MYGRALLQEIWESGAEDKAVILANKISAMESFQDFLRHGDNRERYHFGREPDGSPAEPWGWDDLIT